MSKLRSNAPIFFPSQAVPIKSRAELGLDPVNVLEPGGLVHDEVRVRLAQDQARLAQDQVQLARDQAQLDRGTELLELGRDQLGRGREQLNHGREQLALDREKLSQERKKILVLLKELAEKRVQMEQECTRLDTERATMSKDQHQAFEGLVKPCTTCSQKYQNLEYSRLEAMIENAMH
jgi:hypothetical protein